jgi:hypothetical protein
MQRRPMKGPGLCVSFGDLKVRPRFCGKLHTQIYIRATGEGSWREVQVFLGASVFWEVRLRERQEYPFCENLDL